MGPVWIRLSAAKPASLDTVNNQIKKCRSFTFFSWLLVDIWRSSFF
jgi:hypothetical protein